MRTGTAVPFQGVRYTKTNTTRQQHAPFPCAQEKRGVRAIEGADSCHGVGCDEHGHRHQPLCAGRIYMLPYVNIVTVVAFCYMHSTRPSLSSLLIGVLFTSRVADSGHDNALLDY